MSESFEQRLAELQKEDVLITDSRQYACISPEDQEKFDVFGNNSRILAPCRILNPQCIKIGNYVSIQDNAQVSVFRHVLQELGYMAQHFPDQVHRFQPEDYVFGSPVLEIGEGCAIGRFSLITCNKHVRIGRRVTISERVYISDNTHHYRDPDVPIMFQSQTKGNPVAIGEFGWVGIGVVILPGVKIGKHAVLSANSVVTKDVPDYCMVAGNPARIVRSFSPERERTAIQIPPSIENHPVFGRIQEMVRELNPLLDSLEGPILVDGGIDSFSILQIFSSLESTFSIHIREEEFFAREISTLKELTAYVLSLLKSDPDRVVTELALSIECIEHPSETAWRESALLMDAWDQIPVGSLLFGDDKRKKQVAFTFVDDEKTEQWTYDRLLDEVAVTIGRLQELGVSKEDRVLICAEARPGLYACILAFLIMRVKFTIAFKEMGTESLLYRMQDASISKVLISSETRTKLPSPVSLDQEHVFLLEYLEKTVTKKKREQWLAEHRTQAQNCSLAKSHVAFFQYTSGTTGEGKGAVHLAEGLKMHALTARHVLLLSSGTKYACSASLGWITGIVYGLLAPLSVGAEVVIPLRSMTPKKWVQVLSEQNVEIFYTAPTLLRYLMLLDASLFAKYTLPGLRCLFAVGEALNAECVDWCRRVLEKPIINTWFQTELGAITICNDSSHPYALGKPVPGVLAETRADDEGNAVLCLKPNFPSFFQGYLNKLDVYREKFTKDGWYSTGDIVRKNEDGVFEFLGRNDDIINTGGHLVSPAEIEDAVMGIDGIVEVAVVGVPDKLLLEHVAVFLVGKAELKEEGRRNLENQIRAKVKVEVSTFATPRTFVWRNALPKTPSGKIQRRILRDELQ